MKNLTLKIISVTSAIIITIITIVVGGLHILFLIWNLLPVVFFYFVTKKYFNNRSALKVFSKICLIFLVVFLIIFPTAMWIHALGRFVDGYGYLDGSLFIFISLGAFVFSLIPYIILLEYERLPK